MTVSAESFANSSLHTQPIAACQKNFSASPRMLIDFSR
jgi:hypothetical protein